MRSTACFVAALLAIVLVAPATAQSTDIDLEASDGVTLKATYTSPGRPGPAMHLIHQCNMDRTSGSWRRRTRICSASSSAVPFARISSTASK